MTSIRLDERMAEASLAVNPALRQGRSVHDTLRDLQRSVTGASRPANHDLHSPEVSAGASGGSPSGEFAFQLFLQHNAEKYSCELRAIEARRRSLDDEQAKLLNSLKEEAQTFIRLLGLQAAGPTFEKALEGLIRQLLQKT